MDSKKAAEKSLFEQLAYTLYHKLRGTQNLVFSPAGIYFALVNASLQLPEEQRKPFKNLLAFDNEQELKERREKALQYIQSNADQGLVVEFIGRIFDIKENEDMNQAILDESKGKIKNFFSDNEQIPKNKFLVNALHFRCEWSSKFKSENTKMGTFYLEYDKKGEQVEVEMMFLTEKMTFNASMECKYLQLPYKGNNFFMNILLPFEDLERFEKSFNKNTLPFLQNCTQVIKVNLMLPKFKILQKEAQNIKNLIEFGNEIDSFDQFLCKTSVKVNEKGTDDEEIQCPRNIKCTCKPIDFDMFCDKPFMYIITDKNNNFILMGKVTNPLEN